MTEAEAHRLLKRMRATVCFDEGEYVVTASTGDGRRVLCVRTGDDDPYVTLPPGVIIEHSDGFAQATGPDLPELVERVHKMWLQERPVVDSLGELSDDEAS